MSEYTNTNTKTGEESELLGAPCSTSYQMWWDNEGSAMRRLPNEDDEEYAHRLTGIAWENGEFRFREAISKVLRENAHLADGEDCTLIELKRVMESL